jgi:hypothetical protein
MLTTLVSFTGADGKGPGAALFAEAEGNLVSAITLDGADNFVTVFEIAKTDSGHASAPTTFEPTVEQIVAPTPPRIDRRRSRRISGWSRPLKRWAGAAGFRPAAGSTRGGVAVCCI